MPNQPFLTLGTITSNIPVQISYRIIELFSEGLYTSSSKAIEELVSNAFDAGATNVNVILSPDRAAEESYIVVVDNGEGMDGAGLKQHWLIGQSNKRDLNTTPKGRKQIGKFGIGKLATFVLARRLTHVTKVSGKYFATTMDYERVPEGTGLGTNELLELPLRELSETEAKQAVSIATSGTSAGFKALKLFGKDAESSWTVAIMSDLKELAQELQKGRLSWVLRSAMPLRDDFKLFLDGNPQTPSKASARPLRKWVLGKDIKKLPKPAPSDLDVTEDHAASTNDRFGLTHPRLGRITGYAEVYRDLLTTGKSTEIGRSNGFFVYVHGRLVNANDELFGMPALRYGSMARFRMVVHVDRLDDVLRSSRESVREGGLVNIAQNILHSVFNMARTWLEEDETKSKPGMRATGRIAQSPASLTRRPIIGLAQKVFKSGATPRYSRFQVDADPASQQVFLDDLETRAEADAGLVSDIKLVDISQEEGVAQFDVSSGVLSINTLHPFVAYHREDYEKGRDTLNLLSMAEVLTEAYLYEIGLDESVIREVMDRRDELLRYFARYKKRNAYVVAMDLEDAATNDAQLEIELVAAFDSMGFDAVRIGGNGKTDGLAVAHLPARDSKRQSYSVSLQAKSKEELGKAVSAKSAGISTVALHRDQNDCNHALIVGPSFPTSQGDKASIIKQIRDHGNKNGRTITLMRVTDLAKLVRLVAAKRIGLDRIRKLFSTCTSPEESQAWIEALVDEEPPKPPFRQILETIWMLQQETPGEAVEYSAVVTALRYKKAIQTTKAELIVLCKSLSQISVRIEARNQSVELTQRPDIILREAEEVIGRFPEDERRHAII